MTRKASALPPCPRCGGQLLPISLCDVCGSAAVLRGLEEIDRVVECPECHATSPAQVLCDGCQTRSLLADLPEADSTPPKCPSCATFLGPDDAACPTCGRSFRAAPAIPRRKERRSRRIRGDYDERQLRDILSIPGVNEALARVLLRQGYNAISKLKAAPEPELASIPEIGPAGARTLLRALATVPYVVPARRGDAFAEEEAECPLCACPTSLFASSCLDCGAFFDEEETDLETRERLAGEAPASLLSFYDLRLEDDPEDADLWYARGLLLESLGQDTGALESLERAKALSPGTRKVTVAITRLLSKTPPASGGSDRLRSMLHTMVEDVAFEQEMTAVQRSLGLEGPACPFCDEPVPPDARTCPACSMTLPSRTLPEAARPKVEEEQDLLASLLEDLRREARAPEPVAELEPSTPPTLDGMVQAFEESLSPEELEAAQGATLDWLMDELEESIGPEEAPSPAPPTHPSSSPAPASGLGARFHIPTSRGFLSRSRVQRRGFVNGAGSVNGRARVNGLVNGQGTGLVNGRGHVNGFVNGRGYVNGASVTLVRLPSPPRRTTFALVALGLVMGGLIGALLLVPSSVPSAPISIDGSFEDWTSVPSLDAATPSTNPRVGIARYALLSYRTSLFLFASTLAPTFEDPDGFDGVFFLLDADDDPWTGYSFAGVGADFVVEVYGNGTSRSAHLFEFPADAELNWSRRAPVTSLRAASGPGGVEVLLPLADLEPADPALLRAVVYADDFEGASSRGLGLLSTSAGAILLESRPLVTTVGPGPTEILEIRVRGLGLTPSDAWAVSSFRLRGTAGLTYDLSAESVSITRDQPEVAVRATVQVPGFFPGDAVTLEVLGANADRPVSVTGDAGRAYVIGPPPTKRIDGLFADWAGTSVPDADPEAVNNSNVDIVRSGAATDGTLAYFQVEVAGVLLEGRVPQRVARPVGPGGPGGPPGPSTPPPRRTGEDLLRMYVDMNGSDLQGADIEGILADVLVEVRGQAGAVTSTSLYTWSSGWRKVPGAPIVIAKNSTAIEGSILIAPGWNGTRVVFEATDWSGIRDVTEPIAVVYEPPTPLVPVVPITIAAPEFELAAAPLLGTAALVLLLRRRRARGSAGPREGT